MQLLLTYVTDKCARCGRPILFGELSHDTVDGYICDECREEWYEKCEHCGYLVDVDEMTDIDGNLVCDTCRDENYKKCERCGEWHNEEDMTFIEEDDEWVCDECRFENYKYCSDCHTWHREENTHFLEREDRWICDDCFKNNYYVCSDCDKIVHQDDAYITHNGDAICRNCYEEYYFTCDNCEEIYHRDHEHYDERNDRCYCDSCYENREEKEGIYSYHDFPSHLYSPRFSAYDDANERTRGLLFGVELECDNGTFDFDDFKNWTEDDNLIHFERDGSLSDDGVELITQPCSLTFHQKDMFWDSICDTLSSQGFKSHGTSCCGLHVHIGRQNLPPSVITKMDVFINNADRFFPAIARRDVFYSSKYIPGKKLSKDKCCFYGTHDDRYQAVNTTNLKTVEIRIFRGTLKPETIIGTIEMLHALVRFLETIPLKKINETEQNVHRFIEWCGEHDKKYPHLLPMFERLLKRSGDCSDYLISVEAANEKNRKSSTRRIRKCA